MAAQVSALRERIQSRYPEAFLREKPAADTLPSLAGGLPRGAISEIAGPESSGRTSLLYSLLAEASQQQEFCALLDAKDTFDPRGAALAGIRLPQLLWVRCGGNVEHALKAADLLAQAGGFGLVAIDLGSSPLIAVRRIPMAAWFRLRHAVENTRTALVVLEPRQAHANSSSAVKIELDRARAVWRGHLPGGMLGGFEASGQRIQNHRAEDVDFLLGSC